MNELFKIALEADVGGFVKGMAQADGAVQHLSVGLQGLINVGKAANNVLSDVMGQVKKFGKESLAAGLGIEATAISWGVAASIFDTNMRNVNSLLDLSESKFQSLSRNVLALGAAFPQGPNDAAKGMYEIVSAGYGAVDATNLLKVSLTAASAGMTDTLTAADAVIYALKAYGLGVSSANDVSDILFKTVDLGILNFHDLAQGMGEWVAMAAAAKVPLADASAAIAAMTLAGAPPSEASTSLARIFTSFIKPSKDLTNQVKELGYETPLTMLNTLGLAKSIQVLGQSTGGSLTDIAKMFNDIRAARGVFELLSNDGQNYASVADSISVASNRAGATQAAFAAQSQGAAFKFHDMVNELQRVAISLGNPLLLPAKAFFNVVDGGATILGDLPPQVMAVVAGLAVLTGAMLIGGGAVVAYGLSFTLTTLALNLMAKTLAKVSEEAAAQGFEQVAAKIGVVAEAADHSGGSMIRFGYNLTNSVLTKVPVVSTIVSHLGDVLVGLGLTAVAALAALYVWRQVTDQAKAFDDAVAKIQSDTLGKLHFENLQEAGDSLKIMREQAKGVNEEVNKMTDASVWQSTLQVLGSAGSHLPVLGGLFDSTMIPNLERGEAINNVLNKTIDNLTYLKTVGTLVSNQVFTDFWKQGMKIPEGISFTATQIQAMAQFKGIKLIDESGNQDPAALKAVVAATEEYIKQYGELPPILNQSADAFAALSAARQKFVDAATGKTADSLSSAVDPLSQFDNKYFEDTFKTTSKKLGTIKGEFKNVFSEKDFSNFFTTGVNDMQKFLDNIGVAVKKGFDPNFISSVIQAGPQQAGDLLDTIANSTDQRFEWILNNAETKLAQLTAYGVQMSRLLAIATAPGTSEKQAALLPTAMTVEQAHLAFPKLDVNQIAAATKTTIDQVNTVIQAYGLDIPVHVPTANEAFAAEGGKVKQNLSDTVDQFRQFLKSSFKGNNQQLTADVFGYFLSDDQSLQNSGLATSADMAAGFLKTGIADSMKEFTLDAPFKLNKQSFSDNMSKELKLINPTMTDEQINLVVGLLFKDQVAQNILTGKDFEKPGVKDFIVSLIGDADATRKLEKMQATLKLTPSELYTTFGIIGDKDAQQRIIEYVAKVSGANAQKIVVQVDSSGIAHFFPTLEDAQKGLHEISTTKAAPSVDLKTGEFYNALSQVQTALGLIPTTKNIDITIGGQSATIDQIHSLASDLRGAGSGKGLAKGGFVKFADGGEYHTAEISPPGMTRVWNEPETGGEAYIPLNPSKRGRSLNILSAVANMFGLQTNFAIGGVYGVGDTHALTYSAGVPRVADPHLWTEDTVANMPIEYLKQVYVALAHKPFRTASDVTAMTLITDELARRGIKGSLKWPDSGDPGLVSKVTTSQPRRAPVTTRPPSSSGGSYKGGVRRFDVGGIIYGEKARSASIGYNAGALRNSASFSASVAQATAGMDPVKDAKQIASATTQALMEIASSYQDVKDAAGSAAANALANSGLTGQAWSDAAQRIIASATNVKKNMFNEGALGTSAYLTYLKQQLAATSKYSDDYDSIWNEIKNVTDTYRKNMDTLYTWEYTNGQRSYDQQLKYLEGRRAQFHKNTQDYMDFSDQIKSLMDQHNQDVAAKQDYEYNANNTSTTQYVAQLQARLKATKEFTTDWYNLQQQIQTISKSFSDPFKQATDVITAFSGKALTNFGDVKAFFTHTITSSKEFMDTIKKLKGEGVNQNFLNELLQQGPSALPLAQSILAGGADAAKFVNDSLTQINAITGQAAQMGTAGYAGVSQTMTVNGGINIGPNNAVTPAQVRAAVLEAVKELASLVKQGAKG